jgi:hypothetical protein
MAASVGTTIQKRTDVPTASTGLMPSAAKNALAHFLPQWC